MGLPALKRGASTFMRRYAAGIFPDGTLDADAIPCVYCFGKIVVCPEAVTRKEFFDLKECFSDLV